MFCLFEKKQNNEIYTYFSQFLECFTLGRSLLLALDL